MNNKFYKWWQSHSITVTSGGFLILFALYILPVVKESKYKNTCIDLSRKAALNKFKDDNIKEKLMEETGLTVEELAKIEGYKNCVK